MLRNSSRRGAVHLLLPLLVLAAIAAGFWIYKNGGGGYLAALLTGKTRVKPAPAAQVAAANGMKILANYEYMILRSGTKVGSGQGTFLFKFADGVARKISAVSGESIAMVPPRSKGTTFVSASDKAEIGSIAKDLDSALASKDSVSAIVQFNLPFDEFYKPGEGTTEIAQKKKQFADTKSKVQAALKGTKGKMKKDLKIINGVSMELDKKSLAKLRKNPLVKKIGLDAKVEAVLDTSLNDIFAKDVWPAVNDRGQFVDGSGQLIAIIDTGVDYKHPDLGGCFGGNCKVAGGYDFVNGDSDPMDDMGHGTHVAATAAGKGFLSGVAPGARILAYKVLDAGGSGSFSDVIAGIDYATDPNRDGVTTDHATVGSMSLGADCSWYGGYSLNCGPDDAMSLAVDNSSAAGVIWTIAAGNSGPGASTVASPGTSRSAITVAAACKSTSIIPGVDKDSYCGGNPMPYFSSRGPLNWNGEDLHKPDVTAPGVYICAARWGESFQGAPECFDDQHIRISGTSMATPHVAGAAALIHQAYPSYTPAQVKQLLKSTARDLGGGMTYNDQGAGEINLKTALPLPSTITTSPTRIWEVKSDPTKKLSSVSQDFTVSKSPGVTLLLASTLKAAGVSMSFSQNTLTSGRSATFKATITVDNDLAKAGFYSGYITITEKGGPVRGGIYVAVNVQPTVSIVQTNLDYGVDNPDLSSWTSTNVPITLKNLRLDAPQTVTLVPPSLPSGASFVGNLTVGIPAGGQVTVNTQITANNNQVPNGVYKDRLGIKDKGVSIPAKFVKFYVLTLSGPDANNLWVAWVHDRQSAGYYLLGNGSGSYTLYLNEPGAHDAIIFYRPPMDISGHSYVPIAVKEDIGMQNGIASITVDKADVKNTIRTLATDEKGNPSQIPQSIDKLTYAPAPWLGLDVANLIYPEALKDWSLDLNKISDVSNNYKIYLAKSSSQPEQVVYKWDHFLQGVGGDVSLGGSLNKISIKEDLPASAGSPTIIWNCPGQGGGCGVWTVWPVPLLNQPITQTLYSTAPGGGREIYSFVETNPFLENCSSRPCTSQFISPYFAVTGNSTSPGTDRWLGYYERSTLTPKSSTLYVGRGPFYPPLTFTAGTDLYIQPYWPGSGFILNQDYAVPDYVAIPYKIYNSNGIVADSELRGLYTADGGRLTYPYSYVPLPGKDTYTFEASFPYKVRGQELSGSLRVKFNTDAVPPTLRRLNYYSRGVQSEVYDPIGPNRLEFEVDSFARALSAVTVRMAPISSDFVVWRNLEVTKNGNTYTALIPDGLSVRTVVLSINITNDLGESYSYTFPVQSGEVYDPAPIAPVPHCDYLVPEGCTLVPGPNYDPATRCGMEVVCPNSSSTAKLTVAVDSTTAPAQQLVMGTASRSLASFRLTETSNLEDVKITDLTVIDTVPAGTPSAFQNVVIYKGSALVGSAVASPSGATTYTYAFHFPTPLIIPKNSSATLTVKGDVADFAAEGPAGDNKTHVFSLSGADVTAIGATSNTAVAPTGTGTGNTMTVMLNKLKVGLAPNGPTSARTRAGVDNIAGLSIGVNAARAATVNAVSLTLMGNALLGAPAFSVRLIDPNTGTDWQDRMGNGKAQVCTPSDNGCYVTFSWATSSAPIIETEKSLFVRVDSSNFTNSSAADPLSVIIQNKTDVDWGDGVIGSGLPLDIIDLPVVASISYE